MDCWEKNEIGANLKLNLGKPDQEILATDVGGVLLRKGRLKIRVPGK
jgi:hypothetical protein